MSKWPFSDCPRGVGVPNSKFESGNAFAAAMRRRLVYDYRSYHRTLTVISSNCMKSQQRPVLGSNVVPENTEGTEEAE